MVISNEEEYLLKIEKINNNDILRKKIKNIKENNIIETILKETILKDLTKLSGKELSNIVHNNSMCYFDNR